MKAVYFEKHGGPEVLKYGDLPDPTAGEGEIVADIYVASVNGADWKVRTGSYAQVAYFPYICGRDFSGIVTDVGPGADLEVGDEVFGVLPVGQEGTYCEKVVTNASVLAKKPAGIDHMEIDALSLIGLTAVISIEETLKLQAGEKILIQGGAGGVAGFAIQLAKHIGAHVVTTASTYNHEYVRSLGADEIIDYNLVDFVEAVSDCDAVFETVGGETGIKSFDVLKPGGRAAFIASGTQSPKPARNDVESLRPNVGRDRHYMERVADLLQRGVVSVPEIQVFDLKDAFEAQKISESRHLRGKLMLRVR
ncbi:MAG: 2-haloacrylate reductase [Alphaproteobacteria bacterium MarineAlpha11_Bin1]|nr:MAG: 2-haloacrylate reductase [Alphaproteobacteria bacterium MarineAlpha11_Bin1]|tara:strand:+ start:21777 stop:22697 length:921 start_codon:yes stop_codon:yes gene_type:complete